MDGHCEMNDGGLDDSMPHLSSRLDLEPFRESDCLVPNESEW